MREDQDRTLFVSHEATRTGAPRFLLGLLDWARTSTSLNFEVLLKVGGELKDDFAALGKTHVLDERPPNAWSARFERELGRGALQEPVRRVTRSAGRRRLRHLRQFDIVYLNSTVSASVIDLLPKPRLLISHIHELDTQIEHSLPRPGDRELLFARTDRWIAAGQAVQSTLETQGVDREDILTFPELIPLPTQPDRNLVQAARHRLGIPDDAIVVGTMATIEPRKGPDLFVALAQQLRSSFGDRVHFVWVGAPPGSPWQWPMTEDIRRAELGDVLHLAGAHADPIPYLALMDVFVLASREDPFPLSALEAAALEIPVVSFASGGMSEFLSHGGGELVPALHVCAMASAVSRLIEHPERRLDMGRLGAAEVRRSHDVKRQGPALMSEIKKWSSQIPA